MKNLQEQIEDMTCAEIIAGILRGTLPDFANIKGALEHNKWMSEIDDIDAYAASVKDSAVFSVKKEFDGGYWWNDEQLGDWHCTFAELFEHYLACCAAMKNVTIEWADSLYKEEEDERKDIEEEDERWRQYNAQTD
jgi:hypothetical protein